MNDYEMMHQRVDQLRIHLARYAEEQTLLDAKKALVMEELLDTRRQITRADKRRLAEVQPLAPVDYLDV